MKKSRYMFYIGMFITILFIAYAGLKMDIRKAMAVLNTMNAFWILPVVAIFYFNFYLRSLRWWYIIEPTKPIPVKNLYSALLIGFTGNMIFPMRIGEFIRAYAIAKKERIKVSGAFATIVLERIFDVISTIVLLVIVMFMADPQSIPPETWQKLKIAGYAFSFAILGIITVFYFLADKKSVVSRKFIRLLKFLPENIGQKTESVLESFRGGLKVLRKGKHLIAIVAHSVTVWFTIAVTYYLFLLMFNLDVSWEMALMVTLLVIFGVAIPSSPGFIGPFHAAIVIALGFYGIDADRALGIAIFIHLSIFILIVVPGIVCLMMEKMSLSEIQHSAD